MGKVADQYLAIEPWKLVEEGFHPERSRVSESLFALANEHMGLRGYFDEGYSGDSLVGCYLNGLYEEKQLQEPTAYKGISQRICFVVNSVNWLYTRLELGGETLDLARVQFSDFRRELDFRTGELRRTFVWTTAAGQRLQLAFSRCLSMETKEWGLQRLTLLPLNFSGPLQVTLGVDFSLLHESYQTTFWDCPRQQADTASYALLGVTRNIHHKLFAGFKILAGAPAERETVADDRLLGCRFAVNLAEGQTHIVERVSVLATTRNPADSVEAVWARGQQALAQTEAVTYATVHAANARHWQAFWDRSDITIEGDAETQQGVRYCLFQLHQTYRGAVPGANIGAKGLTGEAYNGNTFWDSETYCLPFYLFSDPAAAKALLDFRYKTLPQALARAKDLDCAGACFPIATSDGTESCTLWQHASLQFHPTTAVAYGIWHYVKMTDDHAFLYSEGAELLIHICRFLASRGQWSPRRHQFGYYAVMGPDEFQMMVNNNSYTNYMAQRTFNYTLHVLAEMAAARPQARADLFQKLGCTPAELAAWRQMADAMILPYDPATGLYEQHEGFFDLPHIDIDAIPVEDFPLYHHWAYDRIYRNDMIKQPDVLMFMFLYNQSFPLAVKQANYDYYEPRCIHESSLSPSVHSILAAELGRPQEAFEFFRFSTRIDLDNYNRNTREGIHITSLAAGWMNIVYGFGGLRSDGPELVFNPTIPAHWQAYSFQITYRQTVIRVQVTQAQAHFQALSGAPVRAVIQGQIREINHEGVTVAVNAARPKEA